MPDYIFILKTEEKILPRYLLQGLSFMKNKYIDFIDVTLKEKQI